MKTLKRELRTDFVLFGTVMCILTLFACQLFPKEKPKQTGHTFDAIVVEVYDGDTVYVIPKDKLIKIRMLDCWAPEVRTRDAEQKKLGFASRDHLANKIPEKSEVRVTIPTTDSLSDSFSFGRVLGRIWSTDGTDLSEYQVKHGHATKFK